MNSPFTNDHTLYGVILCAAAKIVKKAVIRPLVRTDE